jgi:hypothetical protein
MDDFPSAIEARERTLQVCLRSGSFNQVLDVAKEQIAARWSLGEYGLVIGLGLENCFLKSYPFPPIKLLTKAEQIALIDFLREKGYRVYQQEYGGPTSIEIRWDHSPSLGDGE